jgi:hypothetical protein
MFMTFISMQSVIIGVVFSGPYMNVCELTLAVSHPPIEEEHVVEKRSRLALIGVHLGRA